MTVWKTPSPYFSKNGFCARSALQKHKPTKTCLRVVPVGVRAILRTREYMMGLICHFLCVDFEVMDI